jgi:hypothetical protein
MTLISHDIHITTDNGWTVEDLPAEFDALWENADKSVGESGGWSCEFIATKIGGMPVSRDQLIQILDKSTVIALEVRAAESLRDYHGYASLEAA